MANFIDKPNRVGIFVRPIDQGTSGSGSHLRQLVDKILELNEKFDIKFIHFKTDDAQTIDKGVDKIFVSRNPIAASMRLRSEQFDILHYSPLTIFSPVWLDNPAKVATIHGAASRFIPEYYSKLKIWHEKVVTPYYAKKMDNIFTVSETSKKLINSKYGVEKDRIKITYNAVGNEFKRYKGDLTDLRNKYPIDSDFIFHLSKYSERKNPWTILKSFKVIRNKKDLKLVFAGKGWKNDRVINYLKKNELLKDVHFLGFISRNEIVELLNLAEIFVFPSLYEGFGMPNLEAMACGCPVVTSDVFAIPEIVDNAAIILKNKKDHEELANKVLKVLENDELRETLIRRGLKRAQDFSWKDSAETVLNTYERCLENG